VSRVLHLPHARDRQRHALLDGFLGPLIVNGRGEGAAASFGTALRYRRRWPWRTPRPPAPLGRRPAPVAHVNRGAGGWAIRFVSRLRPPSWPPAGAIAAVARPSPFPKVIGEGPNCRHAADNRAVRIHSRLYRVRRIRGNPAGRSGRRLHDRAARAQCWREFRPTVRKALLQGEAGEYESGGPGVRPNRTGDIHRCEQFGSAVTDAPTGIVVGVGLPV
jgi:hypothetical protein